MKDTATLPASSETTARAGQASPGDSAVKQQPVALEIPVTINGARTIEGSDKREPFSESTKTVLVFGTGAVIRLNSAVATGQLLFLTNERTKKEVVCQVVKSKNHRNASGYVELEFTEAAVGFWGMRFPGDRLSTAPQAAAPAIRPAASSGSPVPPQPAAPRVEPPATKSVSGNVVVKPTAPGTPANAKTATPTATTSSIVPPPMDSASLLGAPKAKQRDSSVPPAPVSLKPAAETELVEPWLKKSARATLVVPPNIAVPEVSASSDASGSRFPTAPSFELSRPADQPASIFAPQEPASSQEKVDLSTVDLASLAPFFEVKPSAGEDTTRPSHAPAGNNAETEELKQHAARLQEKLANMNFGEEPAAAHGKAGAEAPSAPATGVVIPFAEDHAVHERTAQILESSNITKPSALLPEQLNISESVSAPASTTQKTLGEEELKIPAWLEPLARNASAPSSAQELVPREKSKRKAEHPNLEEVTAELAVPKASERAVESRVPDFGSVLPIDGAQNSEESAERKSGKGMLFVGVAAGIVLAAAVGWWYMNQYGGVHANVPSAQPPAVAAPPENAAEEGTAKASVSANSGVTPSEVPPGSSNAATQANSGSKLSNAAPKAGSAATARGLQANANGATGGSMVTTSANTPVPREPAEVQVKKPSLGEVHLAAPKISRNRKSQSGTEADAAISFGDDQAVNNADTLGAGLGIARKQPAAPVTPAAVGGDVKPAKLLSSVPPVYPMLAKTQHISGNVTVDALIDANGRVTSMKVISGPTLLQEAAMDALRQWKYQPASLDGKPVAMHLSVTVQFRLQQ